MQRGPLLAIVALVVALSGAYALLGRREAAGVVPQGLSQLEAELDVEEFESEEPLVGEPELANDAFAASRRSSPQRTRRTPVQRVSEIEVDDSDEAGEIEDVDPRRVAADLESSIAKHAQSIGDSDYDRSVVKASGQRVAHAGAATRSASSQTDADGFQEERNDVETIDDANDPGETIEPAPMIEDVEELGDIVEGARDAVQYPVR